MYILLRNDTDDKEAIKVPHMSLNNLDDRDMDLILGHSCLKLSECMFGHCLCPYQSRQNVFHSQRDNLFVLSE